MRSPAADKQSLKFKTVGEGQVRFPCTFCERRAQASYLEKNTKNQKTHKGGLGIYLVGFFCILDNTLALVTWVSSAVNRLFHGVLDSEALRYDKVVCSHIKLLKCQKSTVFLPSSLSMLRSFKKQHFLSKISYIHYTPSYTHWHSTAPHHLLFLLLEWFPHWSPRSFVLILHLFIHFMRIILCIYIKGKIMSLLFTKKTEVPLEWRKIS